jgi:hypothetical protein
MAVGGAAALWSAVFGLIVGAPGAEPHAVAGAGAFVAFFVVFSFVYGRTWIAVTPEGIVAATPFRVQPVPFDEIMEIVVREGVAGRVYAVFTRRGLVRFTSLFARHTELFEVLRDRANLLPR